MVKRGDMMSIDDVMDILSINIIGAIPDDEHVVIATNNGDSLVGGNTLAGQAFLNISRRIMGENVEMLNLDVKPGFFKKLGSIFNKK